jgi:hypothetical protein
MQAYKTAPSPLKKSIRPPFLAVFFQMKTNRCYGLTLYGTLKKLAKLQPFIINRGK